MAAIRVETTTNVKKEYERMANLRYALRLKHVLDVSILRLPRRRKRRALSRDGIKERRRRQA